MLKANDWMLKADFSLVLATAGDFGVQVRLEEKGNDDDACEDAVVATITAHLSAEQRSRF